MYCMIKIAGGLSIPIRVKRGIRQDCPLMSTVQYSNQTLAVQIKERANRSTG